MARRLPNIGSAARLLAVISLWLIATPCTAQTEPVQSPPDIPAAQTPAGVLPEISEIVIQMKSGEQIPLRNLLGPEIADQLLQRGLEQRSVPAFTVAQTEISGTVERDVVRLNFRLQVRVRTEGEWIAVPLSFGELFLTEFRHESQAPGAEAVLSVGDQNSRTWHLKGRGLHTLNLQMISRARPVPGGGWQLNLTLPQSTASHARLDFAVPVDLQRLPTDAVAETKRDAVGIRGVEFWGLSGLVSLSWSEIAPQVAVKPVVQSQTRIKLDLTTIPVSLNGTQSLQISGGSLSEVSVTYPPGFELQEVSARNSANVSVLKNYEVLSTEVPTRTLIRLTSAVEGQLTLGYELELKNPVFPQSIQISLPAIQEANVQTGDLDILIPSGLVVEQSKVTGAQRRRVASDADTSVAATAFRLRSPESRIQLEVKETEAQYVFEEELELRPENNSISLLMRWRVNVLRGSLLELPLQWPRTMREIWGTLPGDLVLRSSNEQSAVIVREVEGQPDQMTLAFPERQTGEFTVEMRCLAKQEAAADTVLSLLCPQIRARSGQPVVLRLLESDQSRIEVTAPASADDLTGISEDPSETQPGTAQQPRSLLYRNPDQPLLVSLRRQDPVVEAEVAAGLTPVEAGLEIRQQIRFLIDHKDLTEVTLFVPERVQPVVRIAGNREPLRPGIGPSGKWTFRLPQAARGELLLEVGWIWTDLQSAAPDSNGLQQLPLVIPADCLIRSIRAQTASWSGLLVADPARWEPIFSDVSDAAWHWRSGQTGSPSAAIPSLVAQNLALPIRRTKSSTFADSESPLLILVSSELLPGQLLTTSLAAWEDVPSTLFFQLADSLQLESVQLGNQLLTEASAARTSLQAIPSTDGRSVRWQILPAALQAVSGPAVLVVKCRQIIPSGPGFYRQLALLRPDFSTEEAALPVVWSLSAAPGSRSIPLSRGFETFNPGLLSLLPWSRTASEQQVADLTTVISTFSPAIRSAVAPRIAQILPPGRATVLCLGSAAARQLTVIEIPLALQILAAAPGCVLIFLSMSLFRRMSFLVPLVITPALALTVWVAQPLWSSVFLPPAVVGLITGLVIAQLQRVLGSRGSVAHRLAHATELPSIFGIPDLATAAVRENHGSSFNSAALQPDASSGSSR